MCILFIAVGSHRRYPLVIAANRDEYHARPSAPLHRWADASGILAGRDGRAGGTWFGVNARGRIAAVTNRRPAEGAKNETGGAESEVAGRAAVPSRGALPARFLRGADSIDDFGEFLRAAHRDFRPFNLLYGAPGRLYCFAGGADSRDPRPPRRLARGFHSISNGALDDPWPKMARGVALLEERIAADRALCGDDLSRMMKDETPAATRAGADSDARRSSIFITGARYGTRATTLLLAARGRFELYEYAYAARGAESGRRHFSLAIAGAACENINYNRRNPNSPPQPK